MKKGYFKMFKEYVLTRGKLNGVLSMFLTVAVLAYGKGCAWFLYEPERPGEIPSDLNEQIMKGAL